ncbi:hypothetical protein COCON_G00185210 [Conger conger]|uniref:Uncharacterized protein n=1 Tax=Conger conger TaxID=82655 RepID=A0A9Q1HRF1_CONCO|nr:hypothetical protein COCON_G00185210 [Conger conger]
MPDGFGKCTAPPESQLSPACTKPESHSLSSSCQFAEAAEGSVSVQYHLGEQSVQNQLSFSVKPGENTGLTIHRLGARTLIRTLELRTAEQDEQEGRSKEEVERLRKRVIELSVQSGVSSVLTAFVAVHAGSSEPVKGSLMRRHVPTPGGKKAVVLRCCPPVSKGFCKSKRVLAGAPPPPTLNCKFMF